MLTYSEQKRVDELTAQIGQEEAIRSHLAEVNSEIQSLQAQLPPLEQKRGELVGKLKDIEKARSEAVAIKTGALASTAKKK